MDAALTWKATGLVMAGGAIGTALRFHTGMLVTRMGHVGYPYATLAVNVAGGLVMGALAALVLRGHVGEATRLFLGVGVLGGFTTFSAFSLELFDMIQRGGWLEAAGYALLSVVIALLALIAGFVMTRGLA